jgi:hypothetical protein
MGHTERPAARVPTAAWILLGGAGIVLAVHVARDWYQLFGPYLIVRPQVIGEAVEAIAPFVLGAAILTGVGRWPAGRRWFLAGVAALAVLGVVRLGSEIAVALWMEAPTTGALEPAMIVLALAASLAAAVAAISVALGLHASRVPGLERPWLTGLLVLFGAVALLGALVLLALWMPLALDRLVGHAGLAMTHVVLEAITIGATVAIAVTAVRAAPHRAAIPEWLIAVGATLAVLLIGWRSWFQVLAGAANPEDLMRYQAWWLNLPVAVSIIALLCLAIGFALGRVLPARRAELDSPP